MFVTGALLKRNFQVTKNVNTISIKEKTIVINLFDRNLSEIDF